MIIISISISAWLNPPLLGCPRPWIDVRIPLSAVMIWSLLAVDVETVVPPLTWARAAGSMVWSSWVGFDMVVMSLFGYVESSLQQPVCHRRWSSDLHRIRRLPGTTGRVDVYPRTQPGRAIPRITPGPPRAGGRARRSGRRRRG